MATSKRAKKLAEICKAGVTKELNALQSHVRRFVDYSHDAGKDPKEIHVGNKQFDAVIADKLRIEARMASVSGVRHTSEGPFMGEVKLLPIDKSLTQKYLDARLPSE